MATTYNGHRGDDGTVSVVVSIDRKKFKTLSPKRSLRVFNHSPSGFEWSYQGSGPAQLALAILLDAFPQHGSDWAVRLHQEFKRAVVANLPREGWILTLEEIVEAVRKIEAAQPALSDHPR
jgi:hypothetical protein